MNRYIMHCALCTSPSGRKAFFSRLLPSAAIYIPVPPTLENRHAVFRNMGDRPGAEPADPDSLVQARTEPPKRDIAGGPCSHTRRGVWGNYGTVKTPICEGVVVLVLPLMLVEN